MSYCVEMYLLTDHTPINNARDFSYRTRGVALGAAKRRAFSFGREKSIFLFIKKVQIVYRLVYLVGSLWSTQKSELHFIEILMIILE